MQPVDQRARRGVDAQWQACSGPVPSNSRGPAEPALQRHERPTGAAGPPTGSLRRDGEYWTLIHDSITLRFRDAKGFRYLSHLLVRPHVEVHALELASLGTPGAPRELAAANDPVLDRTAKAAYRERLAALRERFEDATRAGDFARADAASAEIAALSEQLGAALGLGGRDRQLSRVAERARINVTRTLKAAIAKVAANHQPLGRHLALSVRTGTYCCYAPDPGSAVLWECA